MKCGECGPAVRETASGGRVRREEKKKKRQASWLLEGQWCGESTGRRRFQKGGRSIVEKKKCCCPKRFPLVAAGGNYGGGQLSFVSEVFVLTTWQVLSMQYSVTPSWKIVQRLKFHADWFPGVPDEVSL